MTNSFKCSVSTPLNIASTVLEVLICYLIALAAYNIARETNTTVMPITKAVEVVERTEVSLSDKAAKAAY
jgi:hypothetical protein